MLRFTASRSALARSGRRYAHTNPRTGQPHYIGSPLTLAQERSDRARTGWLGKLRDRLAPWSPAAASEVPRDSPGRLGADKMIHRFDTREPEEIAAAGGFHPHGTDTDFRRHQKGNANSGIVSASDVPEGAAVIQRAHRKPGWTYKIHAHPNDTFNLASHGADDLSFRDQSEASVAGPIAYERVSSATHTDGRTVDLNPPPYSPDSTTSTK